MTRHFFWMNCCVRVCVCGETRSNINKNAENYCLSCNAHHLIVVSLNTLSTFIDVSWCKVTCNIVDNVAHVAYRNVYKALPMCWSGHPISGSMQTNQTHLTIKCRLRNICVDKSKIRSRSSARLFGSMNADFNHQIRTMFFVTADDF